MEYTRDEEHELEELRSREHSGVVLANHEKERKRKLEKKQSDFIRDSTARLVELSARNRSYERSRLVTFLFNVPLLLPNLYRRLLYHLRDHLSFMTGFLFNVVVCCVGGLVPSLLFIRREYAWECQSRVNNSQGKDYLSRMREMRVLCLALFFVLQGVLVGGVHGGQLRVCRALVLFDVVLATLFYVMYGSMIRSTYTDGDNGMCAELVRNDLLFHHVMLTVIALIAYVC